jgi:ubiquinone/menaquinone biosynthesis C-methylase UbiE
MEQPRPVDWELYSKDYYRNINEGGKTFFESGGKKISWRLKKHLEMAGIRPEDNVLDIGCGRGEIVLQSAMKGAYATGVDYSKDSIKICEHMSKKFPEKISKKIKFINSDIKKLELTDNFFDKAFMIDVVEHMHDWELNLALLKIKNSLKKRGVLIIHTSPNTDFYKYGYPVVRLAFPLLRIISPSIVNLVNSKPNWKGKAFLPKDPEEGQKYNKEGHINEQNPRRLKRILKKAGFESKIYLMPFTREIDSKFIWIIYKVLSLPMIRNIFCAEITAVCKK